MKNLLYILCMVLGLLMSACAGKSNNTEQQASLPTVSESFDFIIICDNGTGFGSAQSASRSGMNVALVYLSTPENSFPDDNSLVKENRIKRYKNFQLVDVNVENSEIKNIVIKHNETGNTIKLTAPLYMDCTSGISMGLMAGSKYIVESDHSFRMLGDLVVKEHDIINRVNYSDGLVPVSCKGFVYKIPYRCFYSRNINNLFMAGKNISMTCSAFTYLGLNDNISNTMGEMIGMAAAICLRYEIKPRDIYESYFEELKL